MKLEHQVAPLELAREMKALGFPQDTQLRWDVNGEIQWKEYQPLQFHPERGTEPTPVDCAAPTVAEMGEWLPDQCGAAELSITKNGSTWTARYLQVIDGETYRGPSSLAPAEGIGATEAESRARLLIALAKAGAIEPRELAGR